MEITGPEALVTLAVNEFQVQWPRLRVANKCCRFTLGEPLWEHLVVSILRRHERYPKVAHATHRAHDILYGQGHMLHARAVVVLTRPTVNARRYDSLAALVSWRMAPNSFSKFTGLVRC